MLWPFHVQQLWILGDEDVCSVWRYSKQASPWHMPSLSKFRRTYHHQLFGCITDGCQVFCNIAGECVKIIFLLFIPVVLYLKVHTNSVPTSPETQYVSATKTNRLMVFFWGGGTVYWENQMKHTNKICGQNAEFLYVKAVVHIVTKRATQDKIGYTLRPPLHIGFLLEHNPWNSVLSHLNVRTLTKFKSIMQTKGRPAWLSYTATGLSFHNNERKRVSLRLKL